MCISHGAKRYCTIPGCGKPLFHAWKCRSHFWCLLLVQAEFDSTTEDVLAAANAMGGMCHDASATTSGSVVGGQKFHSIDHNTTILDITDLTLEVIQQYVGMNNWESVLAFVSVCKSWKDATDQYRLKIGVEQMEGGDGKKLNVAIWIRRSLGGLRQFMFHAEKLKSYSVKAKCPSMRL